MEVDNEERILKNAGATLKSQCTSSFMFCFPGLGLFFGRHAFEHILKVICVVAYVRM